MKNITLTTLAVFFSISICLAQTDKPTMGHIGIKAKVSPDNQFVKILKVFQGSPAEISGLKAGDHIYAIDGIYVKNIINPISHIAGVSGTYVKLNIGRYGKTNSFDVDVPRISIEFSDNSNYVPEGVLTSMIHTNDFTSRDNMIHSSMAILDDEDIDIFKYRTYDFDLTSVNEPLLEKEIFKILEEQLRIRGMIRSQNNPDILIMMNFYSGQKEQYVPPQQIVSTHVKNVYNWYWGFVPMPITESNIKEGYTDVTYLTSILLKFMDAHEIGKSKLPPVIWSGSISQASKTKTPIIDQCDDFFSILLWQFPTVWFPNSEFYYLLHYTYTGIIYNLNEMRTIADVIPGSPAAKAGIQKGDEILKIFSLKIPDKYSDAGNNKWSYMAIRGTYSGLRYLFMFSKLKFEPYKQKNVSSVEFKIKRNGKGMNFEVQPEDKFIFSLYKN
jgi:membrane-associated protease RseP (regulator of RpoE activity)